MEQSLNNAFAILVVGMITVLLILGLVVVLGNLLIRITNKFWPQSENTGKAGSGSAGIHTGTLSAIVAAVEAVTGGKGKVTKVEKK
ncbi:oxaloacetate decarboxylase [Mariniphaga sediminis]|uniref:Oxaloacetate decarboxylase n=1 Tax=Mariniphaga sediminis TaxID=1628158 RepID=A0A399D6M9_9BACT|nr:oxaloacetate decarboxylase [Mariniphaga sediminis]RIH67259.1 oxaloacetate decarboxylase [Mariniphaga sediminis]